MTLLIDDDADLVPIKKRRLDCINQNKDSKQIEGFKEQVTYFEMNRRISKRPDIERRDERQEERREERHETRRETR